MTQERLTDANASILAVYFKGGGMMQVTLPEKEAVQTAEEWATWAKNSPDAFGFAGGLGWGFIFSEVVGIHAFPLPKPKEDLLRKSMQMQEEALKMMREDHGDSHDWKNK